jgi:esterase
MILFHRELGGAGKPPLVILHGLLGSSRNWKTAGADLAENFHVFALDLCNHGQSPRADQQDYASMAENVEEWIRANGFDSVNLLGHSMGGKVAMRLACHRPEVVSKLVVSDIAPKDYAPSHRPEFEAMKGLPLADLKSRAEAETLLEDSVQDWGMRKFLLTNLEANPEGGWTWGVNLPALERSLPELERNPLEADDCYGGPTLFLTGGKSNYFGNGDALLAARYFPEHSLVTIAESGHNPHFEAREKFVQAVSDFLLGAGE